MPIEQDFNAAVVINAPGRINLIGEHLDYNGGEVLPAAIDLSLKLSFKTNGSDKCNCYSKNYDNRFQFDLNKLEASPDEWHNYFLGVVYFINESYPDKIRGFDCELDSKIPIGSGVSSSAALECGVAKGLNELFSIGLTDDEIIIMAQKAEHHFVGTKCGIMDQFSVVRGKEHRLIRLNCNDLSYSYVTAEIDPYAIVLVNSNVSHNLATSEYNVRRQECEEGLDIIQKRYPEQKILAQVPLEIINELKSEMTPVIYNRVSYVIQENMRTLATCTALENKDLISVGNLLFESHKGLSELYEVSCQELDYLVGSAKNIKGVIGSRMMGGGFGGCTINLVHKDAIESFTSLISKSYFEAFNIKPNVFKVAIGDGVKRIQ